MTSVEDELENKCRQRRQPITSPLTGLELPTTNLMPLVAVQKAIQAHARPRGHLRAAISVAGRESLVEVHVVGNSLRRDARNHRIAESMLRKISNVATRDATFILAFKSSLEIHVRLF